MFFSPSRWNIEHVSVIDAPIDKVWSELVKIDEWEWNKWTKLEAESATTGTAGKLKAAYDGDDRWETFDFNFGEVNKHTHLLEWGGIVAGGFLFKGRHHMRLEAVSPGVTKIEHKEVFSGLLPILGIGLPYKKLDRNYLLMNEALKAHVEALSS
jgi:hypothetical protein